jgi:hypothetical protein
MQKLWPVKVSCPKLPKTAQSGLNLDWTSGNHGQPDLDANLTFFALLPLDWQPKLNSQTLEKAWVGTAAEK